VNKDYTIEKLTNATEALTVGSGDVRSRLIAAYNCLNTLTEQDFPPNLQSDWLWIIKQLTKYGPELTRDGKVLLGPVENTMRRIQNRTGVKIAKRISDLYWAVSDNVRYR
jgi:hypothetical protein